jgi:hypothetical protein
MNTELNAKQIARIARIRKERKEKLRKMNACSFCCDKTPDDKLVATVDGKYICVECVEDYNADHHDSAYEECDGCNKGFLSPHESGCHPTPCEIFCSGCQITANLVDERDHPNIFPYKKCVDCHERSSCGNYTNDNVWQCESCSN